MAIMNKPRVFEKYRKFQKNILKNNGKIGTNLRYVEFCYHNVCNFKCKHCSNRAEGGTKPPNLMSFDKVRDLADQMDELGIFMINLLGGELLIYPDDIFMLLEAIKPERFYIELVTNGYSLTQELADRFKKSGVDRVCVSIDSMDPDIHDSFRGGKGAHRKAIKALEYAKNADMQAEINITVGHYNAKSDDVESLCKFSADNGYTTLINIAMPCGNWQGKFDVMIDDEDHAHLIELRKKYKNIVRDLWDLSDKAYEKSVGCTTVSKMFITPNGDVLPCIFVHIKLGNIYEQSLKEIVDYAYTIKYFHDHCETCLAGENRWFAEKFMMREMSIQQPIDAREVFKPEDYIDAAQK